MLVLIGVFVAVSIVIGLLSLSKSLQNYFPSSATSLDVGVSFTFDDGSGKAPLVQTPSNVSAKLILQRIGNIAFMRFGKNLANICSTETVSYSCEKVAPNSGIYIDLRTPDGTSGVVIPPEYRPCDWNYFSVPIFCSSAPPTTPGRFTTTQICVLQVSPDGSVRFGRGGNPITPFFDDSINIWNSTVSWAVSDS